MQIAILYIYSILVYNYASVYNMNFQFLQLYVYIYTYLMLIKIRWSPTRPAMHWVLHELDWQAWGKT